MIFFSVHTISMRTAGRWWWWWVVAAGRVLYSSVVTFARYPWNRRSAEDTYSRCRCCI